VLSVAYNVTMGVLQVSPINYTSTSAPYSFVTCRVDSHTLQMGVNRSYCRTAHFCRIASIHQPTNAHIISHKTLLKHFKTLRHVSILLDQHQGALFLAKVILRYSQFNSYLQTRCCGSIQCRVVEQWLGVRRTQRTPSHCSTTHSHTT